jgi:hypothetical protein
MTIISYLQKAMTFTEVSFLAFCWVLRALTREHFCGKAESVTFICNASVFPREYLGLNRANLCHQRL